MARLFSIGESLVDITLFPEKNDFESKCQIGAGGATANVAVAFSRLGGESYFVGKISSDSLGELILKTLSENRVNTNYIFRTNQYKTAVTVICVDSKAERTFTFYHENTADYFMSVEDVRALKFNKNDIVHFCSVGLASELTRNAHFEIFKRCLQSGGYVSFDANVRLSLWKNEDTCRSQIMEALRYVSFLKVSDEELTFITEISDEYQAIAKLFESNPNIQFILVTKGEHGSIVYNSNKDKHYEPAFNVNAIDSTGAGDSFISAMLYCISKEGVEFSKLKQNLVFANAAAALVTTRKGALNTMPTMEEVENFLKDNIQY